MCVGALTHAVSRIRLGMPGCDACSKIVSAALLPAFLRLCHLGLGALGLGPSSSASSVLPVLAVMLAPALTHSPVGNLASWSRVTGSRTDDEACGQCQPLPSD